MSALALEIAGVRVDLASPAPHPGLARYRPFAGASGPARWRIELCPQAAVAVAGVPGLSVVEAEGGRWRISGVEAGGWLDPVAGTGSVALDPGALLLDAFLRSAVGAVLLAGGGLLVHASSVVVDGAAHLFPARSGSGKSTLAALAGHPLADEVSALVPEAGGFRAHATPWWRSRGGSAPLARVYAIAWDGEGVTPLPGSPLRQLATSLVLPLDVPPNRERALAAAAAVARTAPFARLAFRRDSDVDGLLRAAASRGAG